MSGERALVPVEDIAQRIHTVRSQRVILDLDLASLYGVETRVLNQAVKRNSGRFPPDFVIRLRRDEAANLKSQFGDGLGNSVDAGAIAGDLRS